MHRRGLDWIGGVLCAVTVLVPGVALAAAENAEHGGGGLINFDSSLIIQIVNFLVLLVILQRLLYRPLMAKMEERTAAIKRSLEEAQAARAEAARQQQENEARLRSAHAEAAAIRAQALKEAGDEQRRLVEAARLEAQRMIEGSRAQLDAEIRRARDELRREVGDLAIQVSEQLVRRSLRDTDHRRIVDDAIARIGGHA
jgi:F-type H+-transporting ATPase subunit b